MKRDINFKGKLLKFVKEPLSDFIDRDVIIKIDGWEKPYSTKAVVIGLQKLLADRLRTLSDSIDKLATVMGKRQKSRKRDTRGMFMKED